MGAARVEAEQAAIKLMAPLRQLERRRGQSGGGEVAGDLQEAVAFAADEVDWLERGGTLGPQEGDTIRPLDDLANKTSHR